MLQQKDVPITCEDIIINIIIELNDTGWEVGCCWKLESRDSLHLLLITCVTLSKRALAWHSGDLSSSSGADICAWILGVLLHLVTVNYLTQWGREIEVVVRYKVAL